MPVISREESWHLDKKIPIAMIGAILAQLVVGSFMISDAFNDIRNVKLDIIKIERRVDEGEKRDQTFLDRLPRLEEQQKQTNVMLEKIWIKLESLNGSKPYPHTP